MQEQLSIYSPAILSTLEKFLLEKKKILSPISPSAAKIIDHLLLMIKKGKLIRPSLMLKTYQLCGGKDINSIIRIAAGYELLHLTLLVHDDIMDRDEVRRGIPTMHALFTSFAEKKNSSQSTHIGQSLGMTGGDLSFFLGIELITSANTDLARCLTLINSEMEKVGVAQIEDMVIGLDGSRISEEKIISLYRFKTARYTFSLPFMIGALIAKQNHKTIIQLEKLGETLGIIFQLQDDLLDLFGKKTGKPTGSDIRENKKTLLWYEVMKSKNSKVKKIQQYFGKSSLSKNEIETIKKTMKDYGVITTIEKRILFYNSKAEKIISEIKQNGPLKNFLSEFTNYLLKREK